MASSLARARMWRARVAPAFVLDRREAIPALIGRHEDFLIVTGLAGTSRDIAALTEDGAHTYTHGRRHGRRVHDRARPRPGAARQARAGGDGRRRAADEHRRARHHRRDEPAQPLASSASTTATTARPAIRRATPASASISRRSPPAPASSARAPSSRRPSIAAGARLIREGNGTAFVLLRVKPTEPPSYKRDLDPATTRTRFRSSTLPAKS